MGKMFASDPELENVRVYTVTRLIYNYTPSDYDEPGSQYLDDQLCTQIIMDRIADNRDDSLRVPQFRK